MFNPRRIVRFLAIVLAFLLPILGIVLVLGILTELQVQEAAWSDMRSSQSFWLTVLRDLAPSILALVAAYLLAARFARGLYDIDSFAEARGLVHRCLFGLKSFGPWLRIAGGTAEGDKTHTLKHVGGPGHLVVYNDSAAVLEGAGRFTRVQGSGFPQLARFEKIYSVVDLRPKRWVHPVNAMSKEGIPVTCEADISFQIASEGIAPSEERPFPASDEKIFQAATSSWLLKPSSFASSRIMDWSGRLLTDETEGSLRTLLTRYPLDRLIGLISPKSENVREEIRQQLEQRLQIAAPRLGARILRVELGDIQVQDEITQQWINAWQAAWERWATEREALGRAKQAEQIENAKTRAQVMMLTSVSEAFRPLVDQEQAVTSKLVLTRLFMVLSRAPSDPLTRVNLPREAVNTLKLLKDLIV